MCFCYTSSLEDLRHDYEIYQVLSGRLMVCTQFWHTARLIVFNKISSYEGEKVTPASSSLHKYRYHLLGLAYTMATILAVLRVSRQPYNRAIKWEQYETIFKGTTLGAAIAGLVMSGGVNQRRSRTESS